MPPDSLYRAGKRTAQDGDLEEAPECNPPHKQARRATQDPTARRGPNVQPVKGFAHLEWSEIIALLTEHKDQAFELEAFINMRGESAREAFQALQSGQDNCFLGVGYHAVPLRVCLDSLTNFQF
jgi:hypothetical protein